MIKGIYEFISEAQLKKYAELAVRAGVNLQKDQLLIIHMIYNMHRLHD